MSAEKTVGQLYLEELANQFADMTAQEADLGFGGKYSEFREPLAQVAIYRKAEAEANKTYDGKTPDEIKAKAELLHKKTPGKLRKEGKEIPPEAEDTTSKSAIEEKGLTTVIDETPSGSTVNLPEMTITDDTILKDGVKLEGVKTAATEEPRPGETVIEGALLTDANAKVDISGLTLTNKALTEIKNVSDASINNSRILNLQSAN